MAKYSRKEISRLCNIGTETLRYYEKIKLIPTPAREANGYRVYSEEDVLRLRFITKMKKYGFTLKEISDLVEAISNDQYIDKEKIKVYIDDKIDLIQEHIKELLGVIDVLNAVKTNQHLGECDFFQSLITHA